MKEKTKISIIKNGEPIGLWLTDFRKKNSETTDVDVSYDDEFMEGVKKSINKSQVTNPELGSYVEDLVSKASMGIDGYSIKIEV